MVILTRYQHDPGLSPEVGARDLGLSPETLAEGIAQASSPESGQSPVIGLIAQRVSLFTGSNHRELALLDSATTHMILRDPLYFSHTGCDTEAWQTSKVFTIAGSRNIKFREGQATIVLSGGTTLTIDNAMLAPSAYRSLISFKDLRVHGIHTSTVMKSGKEALELRQGTVVLATAYAGVSGLYELQISASHPPPKVSLASELSQSTTEHP
jgi:hypothetical protein